MVKTIRTYKIPKNREILIDNFSVLIDDNNSGKLIEIMNIIAII